MNDDVKKEEEEQQQDEIKANEKVSKVFGNEGPAKDKADPKTTEQNEPEKKATERKQEGSQSATEEGKQIKTYTQAEVDAMMAKARKKYTGATANNVDTEAKVDENVEEVETPDQQEVTQDLATGLTIDRLAQAELKASMAIGGINPSKVQRAVRLIDINNVIENGEYNEEKAKAEIETLLQEWPELKVQVSDQSNGNAFYFGAPEQEEQAQEEKQKGMFSSIFGNK